VHNRFPLLLSSSNTTSTLILGPVHELRTNSRISNGEKGQLAIIDRNAKRLLRLVNSIMEFATVEARRMSAAFYPTLIGRFVEDLASTFRSAVELAGLEYTVQIDLPEGTIVWIDRDKVPWMCNYAGLL
jgi:signal transduction histidine kinase